MRVKTKTTIKNKPNPQTIWFGESGTELSCRKSDGIQRENSEFSLSFTFVDGKRESFYYDNLFLAVPFVVIQLVIVHYTPCFLFFSSFLS